MNIATGLKTKNRIAGKIAKLQQNIMKYNKHQKDAAQPLNACKELEALQVEWAHLIELKRKLALANVEIADKLIHLTETKAELAFWTKMESYSAAAEEILKQTDYRTSVVTETIMISEISIDFVLEKMNECQTRIENLQDEIDAYNANTQI